MPADWDPSKDEYPQKLIYHIFSLVRTMICSDDDLKLLYQWIQNAQNWCYAQAYLVKKELRNHFEDLKEKEMLEERKKNNTRRVASEIERKKRT
jgi:hypothetical protein